LNFQCKNTSTKITNLFLHWTQKYHKQVRVRVVIPRRRHFFR